MKRWDLVLLAIDIRTESSFTLYDAAVHEIFVVRNWPLEK